MKTLEQYLKDAAEQGIIDFSFRATPGNGAVVLTIHPQNQSGDTLDVVVHGNQVTPIANQFPPEGYEPNRLLGYMNYEHLKPHLAAVSAPICELARHMDKTLPSTMPGAAEKTAGLRKLLEAKDCFVRANL